MAGSMDRVHEVVNGPGPWGGPRTGSMGWSMDPGPCFENAALLLQFGEPSTLIHIFGNTPQTGEISAKTGHTFKTELFENDDVTIIT